MEVIDLVQDRVLLNKGVNDGVDKIEKKAEEQPRITRGEQGRVQNTTNKLRNQQFN